MSQEPPPVLEDAHPADYLIRFATSAIGRAYKSLALAEFDLRPGNAVLDLGCGPGADLLDLAGAVGDQGRVVGVDNDPKAAHEARARTAHLEHVEIREGDVHELTVPSASIDRVHTDRVLQHVADPLKVLAEARRVLRPGGKAIFAEPDWGTLMIDYPDLSIADAYRRFIVERAIRNSVIGRQLPRLAAEAGFEVTKIIPITTVYRDVEEADKILGFKRVTERAVAADYLPASAAGPWLKYLTSGPFFASGSLYIVACAPR
jgi:ubiquinone/menaquinone biosynthesis C-methylase UbiE